MTQSRCLSVIWAGCLVAACGTGGPGQVQVAEVVDGKPITGAPESSVMSQEHAPEVAPANAPKEERAATVSVDEHPLVPNHEIYVQQALRADAPDMAYGAITANRTE